MARAINIGRGATSSRLKQPLNPSVRGTREQAGREDKGEQRTSTGQSEGSGSRRRGGRGGGVSGRKH